MKFIYRMTFIVGLFAFNSCAITETFEINEDGSGKFRYDIDMSKVMQMAGDLGAEESSKSTKKKNKKSKNHEVASKVMDTTFTFKSIFDEKKDSIAQLPIEEQQKLKRLEKFTVRLVMDEAASTMIYSMYSDFDSIDELMDMMSPMQSMQSIGGVGAGAMASSAPEGLKDDSKTSYYYDGKVFKKVVAPGSFKEALQQEMENIDEEIVEESEEESDELIEEEIDQVTEEEIEESLDKMSESMKLIFEQSSYKIIYKFPKPVKSITFENTQFSADRKTITVDIPMDDYMEHPEKLSFEVVFE